MSARVSTCAASVTRQRAKVGPDLVGRRVRIVRLAGQWQRHRGRRQRGFAQNSRHWLGIVGRLAHSMGERRAQTACAARYGAPDVVRPARQDRVPCHRLGRHLLGTQVALLGLDLGGLCSAQGRRERSLLSRRAPTAASALRRLRAACSRSGRRPGRTRSRLAWTDGVWLENGRLDILTWGEALVDPQRLGQATSCRARGPSAASSGVCARAATSNTPRVVSRPLAGSLREVGATVLVSSKKRSLSALDVAGPL